MQNKHEGPLTPMTITIAMISNHFKNDFFPADEQPIRMLEHLKPAAHLE